MSQFEDAVIFRCTVCGRLLLTDRGKEQHATHCAPPRDKNQISLFDKMKEEPHENVHRQGQGD